MERLLCFTANEYRKLFSQTGTRVIMVLSIIFVAAAGLICYIIDSNTRIHLVESGGFPLLVLNMISGFVLPVLVIFVASELFTSEFKDGTIKNLFALPVSKGIIYLGKMLAGVAASGTVLLTIFISSLAVSTVVNGFDAFGGIGGFIVSYIGTFIFLAPVLAVTSLISLLAGGTGMAVVMNLLLWMVLGTAGTLVPAAGRFLPTSFTNWYQPLVNGVNMTSALAPLMFMISYCVAFTVAGIFVFEKKEV